MTVEWIRARREEHAREVANLSLRAISDRENATTKEMARRLGLSLAPAESPRRWQAAEGNLAP
jgi:hypothetical protein